MHDPSPKALYGLTWHKILIRVDDSPEAFRLPEKALDGRWSLIRNEGALVTAL